MPFDGVIQISRKPMVQRLNSSRALTKASKIRVKPLEQVAAIFLEALTSQLGFGHAMSVRATGTKACSKKGLS